MEAKEQIKCKKCGEVLAKKCGEVFYFLSHRRGREGKRIEVKIDYKHFRGGFHSITCWNCGAKYHFGEFMKTTHLRPSLKIEVVRKKSN